MGRTELSEKELRRHEVLSRVERKELKLREAAEVLGVSYAQAKRLRKRHREGGAAGLRHGNAGRRSNRALPRELRQRVLAVVRQEYGGGTAEGFGPTLAAEHLANDHGIERNAGTLRQWMLAEGLWKRRRKRKPHRRRRERKAHFGELLQLDGSHQAWLEGRGPKACLMNMVDDATGVAQGLFSEGETTWAAAELLERWVRFYGTPQAVYTDWLQVYLRKATARERLEGVQPVTQFGRMCKKLGIKVIGASSPQAKGRVERANGTHQDRLVKKMRLQGYSEYGAANDYLANVYLPEHNERFQRAPASEADYHCALPRGLDLRQVFCLEAERVAGADMVVRFQNRFLQLQAQRSQPVWPGARVTVRQWRDGSVEVHHEGERVRHEELLARPAKPPKRTGRGRRVTKPSRQHPWRRYPVVTPQA